MRREIRLDLTVEEANTVLEALGQLPYVRVHLLIDKVQRQATSQLRGDSNGAVGGVDPSTAGPTTDPTEDPGGRA